MNKSINKNREKQFYSSKLFCLEPNIYGTYKKMKESQLYFLSNQNTSQTSLETINKGDENSVTNENGSLKNNYINNNSQYSFKVNKNKSNKQHISYIGYLKSNGNAFPHEQRFKWQNLDSDEKYYPTGMTMIPKRKHVKKKNNDNKEYQYKRVRKYVPVKFNDNSYNKTKRVIYPDNNVKDKEIFDWQFKKPLKSETIGGIPNLINKTPWKYLKNVIKIVKRSNSCQLNIFSKDYAKFELPKVRKHFVQKSIDHIFHNRNKSMDFREEKNGEKYQKKNIDINRVNLIFSDYENY